VVAQAADGAIIGCAQIKTIGGQRVLSSVAVTAVHQGTGVGRALMARAVDELRAMGFTEAMLWVLATNPRARRFYEVAGWHLDGGTKHQSWRNAEFDEVRYRISL
jgi:GNAT superfamily N-acetyltransferase